MEPLFKDQADYDEFTTRHGNNHVKTGDLSTYKGNCYLGIDAGSTTTKIALVSEDGDLLYSFYSNNNGSPLATAIRSIQEIYAQLPEDAHIVHSCSTGYGEALLKAALKLDDGEVETVAHYYAAAFFDPKVDCILDIGGQDMKCIKIKNQTVDSVQLNEACSSAVSYTHLARKEGAVAICHGATGKGNDQIRFELGIKALAPDIKVIAPWRQDNWKMDSREAEIEYCKAHGIDLPFGTDSSYSRDRNLWHISHEGLELEDPSQEPNYDHLLVLSVTPEHAPDEGEYVTMTFEKGVPTSVNGKKMKVADIIRELNRLGGKHGIGIIDIVENRVVGMKSRGVYETPGGTILMEAHDQLEELCLDRATMEVKKEMGNKLAQVVYEGKWFTPLREAIQAFVESTQEYVTGEVKFKLYKGNIIKAGTTSPYSLYSESLASFTTGDLYDHHDADGFITLFGLPLKVRAMKLLELENKKNN